MSENLEEGWYWLRHNKDHDWFPGWVYADRIYATIPTGLYPLNKLEIGPRIHPPKEDEG